jgi:creatinine amidohydrolase/Fe(II)-dependent formamide hydrolase-like protein
VSDSGSVRTSSSGRVSSVSGKVEPEHSVRWAELTGPEIGAAGGAGALAVIPLGCTEQHGLHLPVDTDTYQVERLAVASAVEAARRRAQVLVLPTLPFGPASEHHGFAGTISLDSGAYMQVIKDLVRSVLDSGFTRIAVLHGCGGHWVVPGALWDAKADAARANRKLVLRQIGVDREWHRLQRAVLPDSGDTGAGHAGVVETALCMSGREHLVRLDLYRTPAVDRIDRRYHRLGEVFLFSEISDTGALGDAAGATAAAGTRLWEQQTAWLAQLFTDLAIEDGCL